MKLILLATIFLLTCSENVSLKKAFRKKVEVDQTIQIELNKLLINSNYNVHIIYESPIINHLKVVAVNPPYREFPNIFIFQYDSNSIRGKIVHEALSFGIQDKKSNFLDLHTIGMAADFVLEDSSAISFNDDFVLNLSENGSYSVYKNFIHFHSAKTRDSSYSIDKTDFYKIGNYLFSNIYQKYPNSNCIMYDQPKLKTINFSYEDGKYKITSNTDNNQFWILTFDQIVNSRFIKNKILTVQNAE